MNIKTQFDQELKAAQTIVDGAKGRDLTADETKLVEQHIEKAKQLKASLDQAAKSSDLISRIGALGSNDDGSDATTHDGIGIFGRRSKHSGGIVARKMLAASRRDVDGKAFLSGTSIYLNPHEIFGDVPIEEQKRLPQSFLELLPGAVRPTQYAYLQQTVRTNNAAIVAPGALKPTSTYTASPKQGRLEVFAHLSEPIDTYLLQDLKTLAAFVSSELIYGLQLAVEKEVINGDGSTGHLSGLLNTSGIQTQAFAVDPLTTLRSAATKLEILGFTPSAYVLNPLDWSDIETTRNTSGSFDLGGPVDRANRQVWGTQVVLSTQIAAGTAVALDTSVVTVGVDNQGVKVDAGAINDDFAKNQIRMRAEGRFDVAVMQPAGIIKASLEA